MQTIIVILLISLVVLAIVRKLKKSKTITNTVEHLNPEYHPSIPEPVDPLPFPPKPHVILDDKIEVTNKRTYNKKKSPKKMDAKKAQ